MVEYNNEKLNDFNYVIYKQNLWKFIIFGSIFGLVELGLAISLPLLFGDYVTMLRIFIVVFSFLIISTMIFVYRKYDKFYRLAPVIIFTTIIVMLAWASEISIASQVTTNNIMIYLATLLVFGNISLIDWKKKLILFALPQLWFMFSLSRHGIDTASLVSHFVNSNLIFIISIALSFYIYKLRKENHLYITTIEDQNLKLSELTLLDSMTGINNHNSIYKILEKEIEYSKRYGSPLSIIMYDIDYFKKINDTFGHVCGDEVLIKVTTALKTHTRSTDYIGRYGGEEFIVILPNTVLEDATVKANIFRKIIEECSFENKVKLTISGGVTQWVDETAEQLVEYADQLMYLAKENGRNRVESNSKK